jgi:hypothetical protein
MHFTNAALSTTERTRHTAVRACRSRLAHVARRGILAAVAAAGLAGGALAGPFRACTWGTSDPSDTPNLSPMVWITRDSNIDDVARQLLAKPAGSRYALMFLYVNDLADNPADRCIQRTTTTTTTYVWKYTTTGTGKKKKTTATLVPVTTTSNVDTLTNQRGPWMDNGIVAVQSRMQSLVSGLKSRGVQVDGFVFDNETTLHATNFMSVTGAWATIQADPRWPDLATQVGLPQDISSTSVMYWGSPLYYQWTQVMAGRFDAAMNAAVYGPIKAAYPDASVSNYMDGQVQASYASPDITGKLDRFQTPGFGTHDTGEFYGMLTPQRIACASTADQPLAGDPFVALRLEVHKARGLFLSGSARPKQAWVANRSWGDLWSEPGYTVGLASSPYWDELVLQLGMHGVTTFLDWNSDAWQSGQDPSLYNPRADRVALSGLLDQLNAQVGGATGGVLYAKQPAWGDRVVASGRQVGAEMVWRFSFDAGIGGVTVGFTDGTAVTVKPEQGTHGAWLRYPASKAIVMDANGALPTMSVTAVATDAAN